MILRHDLEPQIELLSMRSISRWAGMEDTFKRLLAEGVIKIPEFVIGDELDFSPVPEASKKDMTSAVGLLMEGLSQQEIAPLVVNLDDRKTRAKLGE